MKKIKKSLAKSKYAARTKPTLLIAVVFLTLSLLVPNLFVSAAQTHDYLVVSGIDVSDGSASALNAGDITDLNSDNNNRIQSDGNWPNPTYNASRSIEFTFLPAIPSNAVVTQVTLTHDYRRTSILDGAKFAVWDGVDFSHEQALAIPPSTNTDLIETVDISSYINTTAKVNGLKVRFLAFRSSSGNTRTNHDLLKLTVTYDIPPVVSNKIAATDEDTPVDIDLTGTDVDGGPLTYSIVTNPSHGSVLISGATATYTPATNYNGPDSFTFKANDGITDGNTAAVSITVNPINDAPVAVNQSVATDEDVAVLITLPANDAENNPLTFTILSDPTNGTLGVLSGNQVTYAPGLDYNGPDSFTFKTNDGSVDSNMATVNVNVSPVNDQPVAVGQSVTTNEDVAVTIDLVATDTETAAVDLLFVIDTLPTHGSITSLTGNQVVYTPQMNYHGADSFTFRANDGIDDGTTATVNLTIDSVNDAPVLSLANAQLDELQTLNFTIVATDPEGDTLTFSLASTSFGATLNPTTGEFSWTTTELDGPGSYLFTIAVTDGSASDSQSFMVNVAEANLEPQAMDSNQEVLLNTEKIITLVVTDTDWPANTLTYEIVDFPSLGTLGSISGNQITYLPNPGVSRVSDTFTFRASDGSAHSNLATIQINISANSSEVSTVSGPAPELVVTAPQATPVPPFVQVQVLSATSIIRPGSTPTIAIATPSPSTSVEPMIEANIAGAVAGSRVTRVFQTVGSFFSRIFHIFF